ncbi:MULTISPECIES: phage portal protein [unclassified Bosea (in: a-proteobacteria)]|uniref:phage portal protein n=1 Tax=unclassified Bosea (in: a-proteobacteria) TaxID=2653178 RepID=UPI000F75D849|nr:MULTISPECIES: phage portal protein [unclassified Bosea (in: a-proteobacteria)]AZO77492.1 phage portal protein [Bosea sp. Tri-49]RXT18096.1 phage portal protein [Bosea sp. Tri-39]RXT32694.1 phage portal protein [Bosea sp. Tri-54]
MANWLARVLPSWLSRSKEGEYRPGPYLLSDGVLSAKAGAILNWWQSGYSLQPYSEGGAMVEACVSAYAQTVAMCPGDHWRKLANGGRERVTTSSLSRIMKRPNDYQSISDFLLNLTRRLYDKGEVFALAVRNERREISEIHLMRHGHGLVADDGSIFYRLSGNEIVERRFDITDPIPARDVLHVRLHTPRHPLKGESPILATVLERAMAGAALNQQVAFYLNQSRPSWLLETDQNLTAEQTRQLRERWEEQTTGENAGRTPILTAGLKAKSAPTTSQDGHLADMLKLTDQGIALAFRIPLQILGIGGTPFASTEALMASWKASGLGFALNHIEEAFGLLFGLKGQPDEYLELNTNALMRSNFKERIEALARGVITGIYAPDEARAEEDLPAVEGGHGKMPRVQQQVVPLSYGTEMKPPDPNKAALPAPAPEPDREEDDDAGRSFDDFTRDIDARIAQLH